MAQETERAPLLQVLGANLYRRRVLRVPKMSQPTLAKASKVSINTIAALELARYPNRLASMPQLDTVEKLAAALDCTAADLLDETAYENWTTARKRSLTDWPIDSEPEDLALAMVAP